MALKDDEKAPVIIKKKKKGHGGDEHAGTWKIAYADFVTAMMAFFLMLWLLNATTEAQRDGIADYFSPTAVSKDTSGGGGMLSGRTVAKEGALVHRKAPLGINIKLPPAQQLDTPENADKEEGEEKTLEELRAELRARQNKKFQKAKQQLEEAMQKPGLMGLQDNVRVQRTKEGLQIQIFDQMDKPMFASGETEPLPRTKALLGRVAQVIEGLPNDINISGHTDAAKFADKPNYTNWELSSDRANASRRVLVNRGLDPERVDEVSGRADEDLLVPGNPTDPRNRRISILLKYDEPGPQRAAVGDDGTITATPSPEGGDTAPTTRTGPSIVDDGEQAPTDN
jgi:chemotaxis protein MotB